MVVDVLLLSTKSTFEGVDGCKGGLPVNWRAIKFWTKSTFEGVDGCKMVKSASIGITTV